MPSTNKFGLSRDIPEPVKREIRQASGFGCVICGLGIVQYKHVDPPFKRAKEHDPTKMTLLCPRCHNKVTTGMMSKETVKKAMQNPKCIERGFSNELYDVGENFPEIRFCGMGFQNLQITLLLDNHPVITISPPQEKGLPYLLSATFFDTQQRVTLQIINNEWMAYRHNWDIQVTGNTIRIREDKRKIVLEIQSFLPEILRISRIDMIVNGVAVRGDESGFSFYHAHTNEFRNRFTGTGVLNGNNPYVPRAGLRFSSKENSFQMF